jgi:WhiB family redox-sensing transcriptional regulator
MDQAECAGLNIMIPDEGVNATKPRAVCVKCPVRTECLEYALADPELTGIWGGMCPRQRQQERKRRDIKPRQNKDINHGTLGGYNAHKRRKEDACTPCKEAKAAYVAERKTIKKAA